MVTSTNWHSNVRFLYTGLSVKIAWMRMANLKLRGQNFGAEPQRISTRSIYKKLSSTRSTPNLRNISKEVHDLRNTSRILFCSIVLLLCLKLCVPLLIQLNRLLLDRSICVHQWCVRKLWLHPKWLLATDVAPDQHFRLSFLFGCFLLGRSDPVGSICIQGDRSASRKARTHRQIDCSPSLQIRAENIPAVCPADLIDGVTMKDALELDSCRLLVALTRSDPTLNFWHER